jgi:steroid delta-isomerase-like uncharacterized protein
VPGRSDFGDRIGCDPVEDQALLAKGRYLVLEDNKALVRRWLEEVLTRGDHERVGELFAGNYVLHDSSFPQDVYGLEGLKRYVAAYRFAFPDARFAVEDQIAQGDKVVSRWSAKGTHRGEFLGIAPTGEEVTVTGIEFDHVAGGKIEEAWVGYHPFAGPTPDPALLERGFATLHQAFPDIRIAEADSLREEDKAAFRWLMGGTHRGEFLGVAPTGEWIEAMGMDIVRIAEGEIVEHWGEFDVMGMLRQLGVIEPPG